MASVLSPLFVNKQINRNIRKRKDGHSANRRVPVPVSWLIDSYPAMAYRQTWSAS